MAKAKIAINGFGRIGRLFFRAAFASPSDLSSKALASEEALAKEGSRSFDIVAINDLGDIENLAYLLQHDSIYRRYGKEVRADKARNVLIVEGKEIKVSAEKDPAKLPWKDLGIDIVIEATGLFESFEKASIHIAAGAKRVIITAPAKDADGSINSPQADSTSSPQGGLQGKTILMGVNEAGLSSCSISSNGSCTTNSVSPVIAILSENPGIAKAMLATVHAMTAAQSTVDGPVKNADFRRGRTASQNIAPSTTGAAIAATRAEPDLSGKFDGLAFRVPVATGSISNITFVAKRKTSVEEVNQILENSAALPRWQGILRVTREQLVSSDIIGEPYGAIVDLSLTKVIDGDLVNVSSWYDNEAGYVATLVKHVEKVAELL